ncbi:B-cell receptor CD22-like [Periophthalmus magnuspinnatus]|uniref:B-cell receptor CD22-like n=1 Tax=Periophthalmus magnuspinnatus TaxID=409849 RepID=UPI002436545B|nr:B-cell receptor CD22-like [Periophthalmus magnuspinnatus]
METHPISCLILLVTAVPCYSNSYATIETPSLAAFVGTCVEIKCKVTGEVPDEDALWFWMKDGTWDGSEYSGTIVYSNKPTERPVSPQFRGRVTYTGATRLANRRYTYSNNPSCSVSICGLTVQDSGVYFFRYISKERTFKWESNKPTLRVTEVRVSSPQPPYKQGQTLTLSCNVIRSNPPPHDYRWYKNEQRVSWAQTYVKNLQPEDSGSYTCSAENTVSSAQSGPLQIDVQYKPTNTNIEIVGQTREVEEGRSVTFKCNSDANPHPGSYYWHKDSKYIQYTAANRLEMEKVQRADEGCYSCRATNKHGSGGHSTAVCIQVSYAPQKVRVQADPGLRVEENTTLTLHCSFQSHPSVSSVTWSRGPTWQGPPVHTGPTFRVSSVSVNDSGLYSCTAHNQVGQGTSPPAEVQVMFGPKQAVVLRAEEEQSPDGSSSVTLSCSSHSFPPVNLYTWYRRTEDGVLKVSENINYTVLSTQPGVYYCTAKNQISESTSETVSLFLQRDFVKYIFLALVPLLIILCVFIVYRLKIKRSVEEETTKKSWWRSCSRTVGRWHSSRGCSEDVHAETPRTRDVPRSEQRADMINGTSSANALYSTVDPPKDKRSRPGTSDQNTCADSLFYASLHFNKNPPTMLPKEREDVVYSTVQKHDEEVGDVYENVTKQDNSSNDSSEDEVDVSYSRVNFRRKARSRVTAAEEEYSELNF